MATRRRKAPIPPAPVVSATAADVMAPAPALDRNPLIIGASTTLAYISMAMRQATAGDREAWVDLLDELIERDPHGYSVISKRILAVAGGRVEIVPAVTEEDDPRSTMAKEIAEYVSAQLDAVDDLSERIADLLWAIYYGPTGAEIVWERDGGEWKVRCLSFIHSRRLGYPDQSTWDVYIATGQNDPFFPTRDRWGLRVADYPGKFIIHAPKVRGDYPTREGLGRELAYWFALKGIGARSAAADVERYAKPLALAYYATSKDGNSRLANTADVKLAEQIIRGLSMGSLNGATVPDSIKVVFEKITGGVTQTGLVALCDEQTSKAVLGGTMTTDVGKNGSRAQAETQREDQLNLTRFDSMALATTLRRDLVRPLALLNFPGQPDLVPRVKVHAAEHPDPGRIMDTAEKGARIGLPLDADDIGARTGLKLLPREGNEPRGLTPSVSSGPKAPGDKGAPPPPDDDKEESDDAARDDEPN